METDVINGKKIRRKSFRFLKGIIKIFVRRPKFKHAGEMDDIPTVILSNHAGIAAPLKFELYYKRPCRLWGTYQMTKGFKSVYKYYVNVFLKQKHGFNVFFSHLFGILFAPFANLFYKGNQVIPTYPDARLRSTMRESEETVKKGYDIIIFPEDSSKGYFDKLKSVFAGFAVFCEMLYKKGKDIPVAFCYYSKKKKTYVFDRQMRYSELRGENFDKNALANKALMGINALGETC